MATEIATITKAGESLDRLSEGAQALSIFEGGRFSTALAAARMMAEINEALDAPGVREAIMPLIDSGIGVRTDRAPGNKQNLQPYRWQDIKPAVIEATMRGLPMVGNCWNIISARCYVTKEGFGLLLKRFPGLRYSIVCGVPHMADAGAVVDARIRWSVGGQDHDETVSFAVRLNAGMGADAAIGKATRKARAWLYGTLTGTEAPEGEAEDVVDVTARGTDAPAAAVTASAGRRLAAKMAEAKAEAKAEAATAPDQAPVETVPTDPEPAKVPYKLASALAATAAAGIERTDLLLWLIARGTLANGQKLEEVPQNVIDYLAEHPQKAADAVRAWKTQPF